MLCNWRGQSSGYSLTSVVSPRRRTCLDVFLSEFCGRSGCIGRSGRKACAAYANAECFAQFLVSGPAGRKDYSESEEWPFTWPGDFGYTFGNGLTEYGFDRLTLAPPFGDRRYIRPQPVLVVLPLGRGVR
jgi:hypothetical protein